MKKFLYIIQLILVFVLFQSADKDSNILTTLLPIHPPQMYFVKDNAIDTSILDNDGNLYLTTWDLGDKDPEEFKKTEEMCEKKIYPKTLIKQTTDISELSETDIKPSLFKENGQCFISQGYVLKAKNGFSPDKFKFTVSRSHAKSSFYMPVGGYFYIVKKQAKYIDVYRHVIQCKAEANQKGIEAEEIYDDSYSYVSIEAYFKFMKSCLTKIGYSIEGGTQ